VNILKRIRNYLAEVVAELKKVSWIKGRELLTTTVVVIAFSTLLAGFIFLFDFVFSNLLKLVLPG